MIGWRKLAFGTWAFTLTWAWLMWGPQLTEKDHEAALVLQGSVVAAVIGGNAYEHRQRRKTAQAGTPPGAAAEVPGTAPATEAGAAVTPAGAPNGTET
jgi:hypothetical protein